MRVGAGAAAGCLWCVSGLIDHRQCWSLETVLRTSQRPRFSLSCLRGGHKQCDARPFVLNSCGPDVILLERRLGDGRGVRFLRGAELAYGDGVRFLLGEVPMGGGGVRSQRSKVLGGAAMAFDRCMAGT